MRQNSGGEKCSPYTKKCYTPLGRKWPGVRSPKTNTTPAVMKKNAGRVMSSDITLSSDVALSRARYFMSSCDRKAPAEFSKLPRDIQESLSLMVTNRAALWRSKIWFRYVCFPEIYILRELIFTQREKTMLLIKFHQYGSGVAHCYYYIQ